MVLPWRKKQRAWEAIARIYNSQPDVNTPRTSEQLRKCWNNVKLGELVIVDCIESSAKKLLPSVDDKTSNNSSNNVRPGRSCNKSIAAEEQEPRESSSSCSTSIMYGPGVTSEKMDVTASLPTFSVTTSATERYMPKNRREGCGQVITEKDARVKRVTDGTHQQLELHELKKKIAEEELLMIKERREQQRQIAIVERKQKEEMLLEQRQHQKQMFQMEYRRAELSVQAAADEAELASLKLQQFKKNEFGVVFGCCLREYSSQKNVHIRNTEIVTSYFLFLPHR
ncbi:Myb/SANT-like DNA-binding domain [Popillia japonica]|uniref:Regulatory protein zeste n=1 Tax=Popillia japonica TaxID=7064 RepID=A0AAW1MB52_POPJA